MPTYRSNSNKTNSAFGIMFRPREEIALQQYINLDDYPWLVKLSDNPPIKIQSKLVFENFTDKTKMSPIFTFGNKFTIEVRDGDVANTDDGIIDIRVFMGHTDNQVDFVPFLDRFRFRHITQQDVNGVEYPYWFCSVEMTDQTYQENLIPTEYWRSAGYPFFSIAVVYTNITGSANVYLRDVRQITNFMI